MKAVIQAGGKGTRLRPYTMVLPKPLMPIDDLPVIEILLKWLRQNDVEKVYVTTGYLGHLIRALCGDGSQWGMSIEYCQEHEPLGTIGALCLLRKELNDEETFLMLNGDVVTDLDLQAFQAFHKERGNLVTVAMTEKNVKIDLGVIHCKNQRIQAFEEKPTMKFNVSMGIYCMEIGVLELIPQGIPFGFDNLMHAMLARNLQVNVYEHCGMWLDIGRPEDLTVSRRKV
jgi:NDP-sugar pyrophosphorylase family protein